MQQESSVHPRMKTGLLYRGVNDEHLYINFVKYEFNKNIINTYNKGLLRLAYALNYFKK